MRFVLFVEVSTLGIKFIQKGTKFGLSLRKFDNAKCSSLWETQLSLL